MKVWLLHGILRPLLIAIRQRGAYHCNHLCNLLDEIRGGYRFDGEVIIPAPIPQNLATDLDILGGWLGHS
jgi:hypothetical protein